MLPDCENCCDGRDTCNCSGCDTCRRNERDGMSCVVYSRSSLPPVLYDNPVRYGAESGPVEDWERSQQQQQEELAAALARQIVQAFPELAKQPHIASDAARRALENNVYDAPGAVALWKQAEAAKVAAGDKFLGKQPAPQKIDSREAMYAALAEEARTGVKKYQAEPDREQIARYASTLQDKHAQLDYMADALGAPISAMYALDAQFFPEPEPPPIPAPPRKPFEVTSRAELDQVLKYQAEHPGCTPQQAKEATMPDGPNRYTRAEVEDRLRGGPCRINSRECLYAVIRYQADHPGVSADEAKSKVLKVSSTDSGWRRDGEKVYNTIQESADEDDREPTDDEIKQQIMDLARKYRCDITKAYAAAARRRPGETLEAAFAR